MRSSGSVALNGRRGCGGRGHWLAKWQPNFPVSPVDGDSVSHMNDRILGYAIEPARPILMRFWPLTPNRYRGSAAETVTNAVTEV
jgi:hypothetical protein